MVVGQQDVRDPADAELRQQVEHPAGAEVDDDGVLATPDDVDVARVADDRDPGRGLLDHGAESRDAAQSCVETIARPDEGG